MISNVITNPIVKTNHRSWSASNMAIYIRTRKLKISILVHTERQRIFSAERRDERKVLGLDSHTGPEPQQAPWIRGGPWCFRYSVHLKDLYYFHCSIVKPSVLSRLASAPLYRKASAPIIVYLCLPLNYSLSTYPPKLVLVLCSCFVQKVISFSAWPGSCPDRLPSQAPVQFGILVLDSGCLSRGLCPTLGIGIHRDLK